MNNILKVILPVIFVISTVTASDSGKQIFEKYCWGCHHQTSEAFGPSFEDIANKRSRGEIQGHIMNPKSTYEQLGHKRSVMPSFSEKLSQKDLDVITNFIYSFKNNKD